jgi:hypothetical protein
MYGHMTLPPRYYDAKHEIIDHEITWNKMCCNNVFFKGLMRVTTKVYIHMVIYIYVKYHPIICLKSKNSGTHHQLKSHCFDEKLDVNGKNH